MPVADDHSPTPATTPPPPATPSEFDRLEVLNVPDSNRYELILDAQRVGLADYSITNGVVIVPHVETSPAHRGKNFAARLMAGVLDDVRDRGMKIAPLCPYADAYMRRHPDTEDLRSG